MAFLPRLSKPEAGNPYYNTQSKGGYSNCIVGQPTDAGCNVLSNCVGYAKGRFNEIYGKWAFGLPGDAEDFWNSRGNLKTGQVPRAGALMVWRKGPTFDNADGAGHVAVVEIVHSDSSVTSSESAYNGSAFYTARRSKGDGNWGMGSAYHFLGFIYQPDSGEATGGSGEELKSIDGMPMLHTGMSGGSVKALQILLNGYGYDCGNADEIFGGQTRTALMKYQTDTMGAKEADGVCGGKTWAKLLGL